ncbi:hypothetical protein DL767_001310 [Monosporascus sp. MG133]|nr:hypothetical protein DL767_001310 [Monosporascus sp. MG133]
MSSVASRLLRRDRDSAPPSTLLPLASLEEELGRLCTPLDVGNGSKPQPVSEGIVVRIQTILRHIDEVAGREVHAAWWPRPRTYAILRTIHGLQFMDAFVKHGWSDFYLPVHEADLPEFVQDEAGYPFRERFLSMQEYYLSPTKDIEKASLQHFRLYDGDSIFKHIRRLGQGGFGSVDCVWSTLSFKQYARKRVFKGGEAEHSKQAQRRLVSELKTLKGLEHQHLVKILGSYTDTQYIAYIMSPVATLTLGEFLASKKKLGDSDMAMLRRFYGCLAAAVNYLHQSRVRHNDITRRNVLIYRGEVYIADFGSCHSWSTQTPLGSRTRHITTGVSPDYMAPEIARPDSTNFPKGRAADMWSLGVLFLEMTTRLLGRHLEDLQASLKKSSSKISKPGFLYANPQFVAEWMETLRRSSHISQHDNEPLQWIRVLLQKVPGHRFTSVTLMNRILDSPSFTEFHCFKCHGEFVNCQRVYQSHAPRFDPEDDSQAMMNTVGGVFGGDEEDLYESRPSEKTINFIERWRAGASAPIIPEYPNEDAQSEEELVFDDDASLHSEVEEFQANEEPSMAAEQLLYGLGGQSSAPEYPQESHDATSHHGQANTTVQDGSVYTWDWDRSGITDGPGEAVEGSNAESKSPATPRTSKDSDPTALFEEAESASSNDGEDDTRMFEEISDKSDSSSDVSFALGADSNAFPHIEHDDVSSSDEEVDARDVNTARVRVIESSHGMFEEKEEISASEPEESPSKNDIILGEEPVREIAEAGNQEPRASLEKPVTATETIGGQAAQKSNQRDLRNSRLHSQGELVGQSESQIGDQKHSEVPRTVPGATTRQDPNDQQPESQKKKIEEQPDETQVEIGTHEPPQSPQVTAPSKPKPSIRRLLSSTGGQANGKPKSTQQSNKVGLTKAKSIGAASVGSANTDPSTTIHPKGVPSVNVQPPDNEPAGDQKGDYESGKGGRSDTVSAPVKPLSKKNLGKMAPKRPKKRDPVELLNPASFLRMTGDDASSIATSAISDNTKKSIIGLGLPIKQADKLKDFLTLHCEKGKAAVVRWLLAEGCNPGTTKHRRAGPIVRAVRGRSRRHIKCVGALIQYKVNLNVQTTRSGKTPLHFAIENDNFDGYEKLIWLLIEHGARVDKKSREGETALTILFSKANEKAFERHHLQALAILLNAGADVNCTLPATGDSPLHMAVRNKDDWATTMLLHKGADVTAKNASGTTPVQVTANQFRGHLSREHGTVLNIILKYIADKDKKAIDQRAGAQGRTALHHAVISGTAQAVELLLKYGASALATDARGHDALHHALTSAEKLTSDARPIEGHVEIMEQLTKAASREWPVDQGVCAVELACADDKLLSSLLDSGLGPSTMFKNAPLLHHALRAGNKGVVEMLVGKGAFVDARNKPSGEGQGEAVTGVELAISLGAHDSARLMAQRGKFEKEENRVSVKDVDAMTKAVKKRPPNDVTRWVKIEYIEEGNEVIKFSFET